MWGFVKFALEKVDARKRFRFDPKTFLLLAVMTALSMKSYFYRRSYR
jgi:hypothetical protein